MNSVLTRSPGLAAQTHYRSYRYADRRRTEEAPGALYELSYAIDEQNSGSFRIDGCYWLVAGV
jgi:hypothetical protein